MPKFMFLQRGSCDQKPPEMTPEQMQAGMQAWMDWVKNGTEAGWLLDPGSPLSGAGAVVQPDLTVNDGPFVESKELVGGYSIVEASDLAEACELAKQTMQLAGGGKIEVREFANLSQ
ncbi:YciI family protein [Gimesia panareensis]|uniref:YCII-related domain protein n=1 Tax=Gimesia panareensis TaxID=2527978 RepID=A0A518FQ03_9PLAN|nr:YciI family protein [Gimesia panareensis]QDT25504.1 YCII-related domain protein [Gimesia panareensis]QDU48454.1 YCII-related domain protein [Gimesia panareensis]QDV18417.1 YCII-related domain protein [Gimesia panareensis]